MHINVHFSRAASGSNLPIRLEHRFDRPYGLYGLITRAVKSLYASPRDDLLQIPAALQQRAIEKNLPLALSMHANNRRGRRLCAALGFRSVTSDDFAEHMHWICPHDIEES